MFQEDLNNYLELDAKVRKELGILSDTLILRFLDNPWFTGINQGYEFIFWFEDSNCYGLPNQIAFPAFWWGHGIEHKRKHKITDGEVLSFHTASDRVNLFSMSKRLNKEQAEEVLKRNAIKNWSIAKKINGIKVTEREIK